MYMYMSGSVVLPLPPARSLSAAVAVGSTTAAPGSTLISKASASLSSQGLEEVGQFARCSALPALPLNVCCGWCTRRSERLGTGTRYPLLGNLRQLV